jgi:hypothetical protein
VKGVEKRGQKAGTPCIPFLEGFRVPGIVSWLSDRLTRSTFSPFLSQGDGCQSVAAPAAFIPDDSGGTAAESHRIPLSLERTAPDIHTTIARPRQEQGNARSALRLLLTLRSPVSSLGYPK